MQSGFLVKYQSPWQHMSILDQMDLGTRSLCIGQVADICLVDRQTVKRWIAKDSAPKAARRLLWIVGNGFLPDTKEWSGFSIGRDNRLYTSHGFDIAPGEIAALQFERQLTAELKRKNQELEEKNQELEKAFLRKNFLLTAANDAKIA